MKPVVRFAALTHLLGAALALSGCEQSLTQVVVIVEPGAAVRAQSDAVRVRVTTEPSDGPTRTLAERGRDPWSARDDYTIVIVGSEAEPRRYRVEVSALSGDTVVASARLVSGYGEGETRYVKVALADACVGVACGDAQTCATGRCVEAAVEPGGFATSRDHAAPAPY